MNIKPIVYENLTTRQRLMAVIEAKAREDIEEITRLGETCPKRRYELPDFSYLGMLEALERLALAVSCDIYRHSLNFMTVLAFESDEMEKENHLLFCLQNIVDIYAAWNETLKARGIDPDTMNRAFLRIRSNPLLNTAIDSDFCPEPDCEGIKKYRGILECALDLKEYSLPLLRTNEM